MNRKTKYIILSIALLTVLAAIAVSLGGRPAPGEAAEETPVPGNAEYVTGEPKPSPPAPPSAPDSPSAPIAPPSAPETEPGPASDIHAVVVTAGSGGTVEPRGVASVRDGGEFASGFSG